MPLLWWVFPPHHRFPPLEPEEAPTPPSLGLLHYRGPLFSMTLGRSLALFPVALRRKTCGPAAAPSFDIHALSPRHLEHQLGQAQARSRQPLRQRTAARRALPARDQMCRRQVPRARARALGFPHIAVSGQKGYHGVAILSRLPFTLVERRDICGRGHARHLSVKLGEANRREPDRCCTTSTCRQAATFPTPCSTRSSATSSISSRRWARGSAACAASGRTA